MLNAMVLVRVKLFKGQYKYLTCPVKLTPYLNRMIIILITANAKNRKQFSLSEA